MPGPKLPENDREDKRGKGNILGEYGWGFGMLGPFRLTGGIVKERSDEEGASWRPSADLSAGKQAGLIAPAR